MVTSAPAMSSFRTSCAVCTPLVAARLAFTRPNRMAIQRSGSRMRLRRAQDDVRHHLQRFDVDVGLVEPVEQHQPVRSRRVEPVRPYWPSS